MRLRQADSSAVGTARNIPTSSSRIRSTILFLPSLISVPPTRPTTPLSPAPPAATCPGWSARSVLRSQTAHRSEPRRMHVKLPRGSWNTSPLVQRERPSSGSSSQSRSVSGARSVPRWLRKKRAMDRIPSWRWRVSTRRTGQPEGHGAQPLRCFFLERGECRFGEEAALQFQAFHPLSAPTCTASPKALPISANGRQSSLPKLSTSAMA
jgi:hypothetical protein